MTRSAANRDADRMARAKKVRGEEHWLPAKASPVGLLHTMQARHNVDRRI